MKIFARIRIRKKKMRIRNPVKNSILSCPGVGTALRLGSGAQAPPHLSPERVQPGGGR